MKIDITWKRTVATLIFKCFKAKNQKLKLNNPVIILARSVLFWLILNKFFPLWKNPKPNNNGTENKNLDNKII